MARICSVCGKKADTAFQTGNVLGSSVICWNCYSKIKSFSMHQTFQTPQEWNENEAAVMKELEENAFPQKVIEDYLTYFDKKKNPEKYAVSPVDMEMITTAQEFSGFRIRKYHGLVSGEVILKTSSLCAADQEISAVLSGEDSRGGAKINEAREAAAYSALREAVNKGANAIVGAKLNLISLGSELICFMISGTAVTVEKETEQQDF